MADDQEQDQKTEQPTPKRLEEAYKKGNVPFSREIGNFMIMMMIALTVSWFAADILHNSANLLTPFLAEAADLPTDANGVGMLLGKAAIGIISILAVPVIATIAVLLAASVMQNGIVFSSEPIMPQLSRISILAGIKRLFSLRSVVEFVKSILKIGVVAYVCFLAVYPEMPHIRQLPNSSVLAMLLFLAMLAKRMTIAVAIVMFFIALFDLLYQRFQFTKSLRMTRQEIKDEYRQSEGDPLVKQRLRRLRMDRARKRMMSNVPKADVIITNPTHFAIALQYDLKTMKAPTVIAKGQDLIALKIREIGEKNNIPVIENPPLARALFDSTELEQEIPAAHYEAVAKIISYVYQLKGKRM